VIQQFDYDVPFHVEKIKSQICVIKEMSKTDFPAQKPEETCSWCA